MTTKQLLLSLLLLGALKTAAQEKPVEQLPVEQPKKWYELINLRGYIQARQNNIIETNDSLGCEQCDRQWGGNSGVGIRRARLTFTGQVRQNIFFKLEADFATQINGNSQNFSQVRDAFVDVGLDSKNEYRLRIGQSKVPYGFENMQSSQVRLNLDRSDAINSASLTERDLGVFFYWAPTDIKKLYNELVSDNFKGSGDYGVFAAGIYNGQTANRPEMNKKQHFVARAAYPFRLGGQIIEPAIQAYSGKYVMFDAQLTSGVGTNADKNYLDQRAAVSLVLFPRPFGVQAEYNIGKGPEFDKASQSIVVKDLEGGYVLVNYRLQFKEHLIFPYARYQYYDGGKKFELDARSYKVNQFDIGIEWQLNKAFEVTAEYVIAQRRYEDFALQNNNQKGNSLRVQAQVNF